MADLCSISSVLKLLCWALAFCRYTGEASLFVFFFHRATQNAVHLQSKTLVPLSWRITSTPANCRGMFKVDTENCKRNAARAYCYHMNQTVLGSKQIKEVTLLTQKHYQDLVSSVVTKCYIIAFMLLHCAQMSWSNNKTLSINVFSRCWEVI